MNAITSPEPLESRIAPALVVAASHLSATFTDVDGDLVIVKSSKPILDDADFIRVASGLGEQLQRIDFSDDDAAMVKGANLTITAVPHDPNPDDSDMTKHGDGFVNIGYLNATGRDLGVISIKGDLGEIDAGAGGGVALKTLSVHSLGALGFSTGADDLHSACHGTVGKLVVKTDLRGALFCGGSFGVPGSGSLGSVAIGGSIIGGTTDLLARIQVDGDIGPVVVKGSIIGGLGVLSGSIYSGGGIKSLSIGGSLVGGDGESSGRISGPGKVGAIKIGHDVRGGSGKFSGSIQRDPIIPGIFPSIASVTVGGSLVGGGGDLSGSIEVPGSFLGPVKIGHDVRGGAGSASGSIGVTGDLASVVIGGSLIGGSNNETAVIICGTLGPVKIGGDMRGGSNTGAGNLSDTGSIIASHIRSVTVGGSIFAGTQSGGGTLSSSGAINGGEIGSIVVKGSLVGNSSYPVVITAHGQAAPTATTDVAIKSLTVGGRVEFTDILAGYSKNLAGTNADAQIGAIKIGGDWRASYVIAGVNPGGGGVGTSDDTLLPAGVDFGSGPVADGPPISKIASIVIAGQVLGNPGTDMAYGFGAEQIGSFKYNGITVPLKAGASNDTSALGKAHPVGASLSTANTDGFAMHVFEV